MRHVALAAAAAAVLGCSSGSDTATSPAAPEAVPGVLPASLVGRWRETGSHQQADLFELTADGRLRMAESERGDFDWSYRVEQAGPPTVIVIEYAGAAEQPVRFRSARLTITPIAANPPQIQVDSDLPSGTRSTRMVRIPDPPPDPIGDVHRAAVAGNVERLTALLDAQPSLVHARHPTTHVTLAHQAAGSREVRIIAVLAARGATLSGGDDLGQTPLHWAAGMGDEAMVRELLRRGARADIAANDGRRPLHAAARSGQTGTARVLLEQGADRTARSHDGLTAAELARAHGHNAVADLLQHP
jgi:hypothetical protein